MIDDRRLIYQAHRMKRMEAMLDLAERKLAGLYRETSRYRMSDVLDSPCAADAAWNRRILLAQIEAAARGEDYTMASGL